MLTLFIHVLMGEYRSFVFYQVIVDPQRRVRWRLENTGIHFAATCFIAISTVTIRLHVPQESLDSVSFSLSESLLYHLIFLRSALLHHWFVTMAVSHSSHHLQLSSAGVVCATQKPSDANVLPYSVKYFEIK